MPADEPAARPARYARVEDCADALIERLGGRIVLALPLGLGKAAHLANALYARAKADPELRLEIFTALSLELPKPRADLEARLLGPIAARLYRGCPELDYAVDQRTGRLPANVRVVEFYFRPGANLGVATAQQNYTSLNYTHAARQMVVNGANVVAQMVAERAGPAGELRLSLSCNPDVTLDLLDVAERAGARPLLVGELNAELPYMPNGAELPDSAFDCLIDDPACTAPLFPVPNRPVLLHEHAIALRVAALVKDGGTLQIGIGSLGDAVSWAIGLRRVGNTLFRELVTALGEHAPNVPPPELDDFPCGLYGCSEMLVEGFLHLRAAGVLRRATDDGVWMHGGFFLGSARFYETLRGMSEAERAGIDMTRISFTNSLLGDEARKRRERALGRFVNTAMMVTLTGAAVSDGLEDGRVVSGVGGQYNFVAMAHELEGGRSILMVPATRVNGGRVTSNVVGSYGHVTIPRHLRDIVVTEYGVADLRGRSDRDVIAALIEIADSRFQDGLRRRAIEAGKLEPGYSIPERCRTNLPAALEARFAGAGLLGRLPWYPLGSDLTEEESALAIALGALADQRGDRTRMLRTALAGWRRQGDPRLAGFLGRMTLERPRSVRDRTYRMLVAGALLNRVLDGGRPLFPEVAPVGPQQD
jgi:acyl-CoA hydrolase